MQVALIGLGSRGQRLLPIIQSYALPKWCASLGGIKNLKAVQAILPSTLFTTDLNQISDDSEVKSVFICTPPSTHFEIAMKFLAAGKNVFVEKPGALTVAQATELREQAKARGMHLFVGFNWIYDSHYLELKKQILDLPDPSKITAQFTWNKWGSFHYDVVSTLHVHDFSIAAGWLGRAETLVLGSDARRIQIHYRSGALATFEINRESLEYSRSIQVSCQSQSLSWDEFNRSEKRVIEAFFECLASSDSSKEELAHLHWIEVTRVAEWAREIAP